MYRFKEYNPVVAEKGDYQYHKAVVLKEFIESHHFNESDNNLIALYGAWGSGKSTVFKTLENGVDKKKYIVLTFEAWKYEKDKNLPLSLYEFILDGIIGESSSLLEVIKEGVGEGLKSFSRATSISLGPITIDGEKLFRYSLEAESEYIKTSNFLEKCNEQINKYLKNKKLIVLIDDLDRCDDENIIPFISALKLMFSLSNVIFICGIDKMAIEEILKKKYDNEEKRRVYLDKIFPVAYTLGASLFKIEKYDKDFPKIKNSIMSGLKLYNNLRIVSKKYNKYTSLLEIANDSDETLQRIKRVILFIIVCAFNDLSNVSKDEKIIFKNHQNSTTKELMINSKIIKINLEDFYENIENPTISIDSYITFSNISNDYINEIIKNINKFN